MALSSELEASLKFKLKCSESESEMIPKQEELECLSEMKRWVENDAEFYGRSDEDFLLMFLRGCEFDINLTKVTLTYYYESRIKLPQWWANRNLMDENIFPLLQLKLTTAFQQQKNHHPTVYITTFSRMGENLGNFDHYLKLSSIAVEAIMRRSNAQLYGGIWIIECQNYKSWFGLRILSLTFAKHFFKSFHLAIPIQVKAVIIINAPAIATLIWKLFQPFLTENLKERIHIYGSDMSKLLDHVSIEMLPEEYGGKAGPMKQHEDQFIKEVLQLNDYIVEDNKYGFREAN